MVAGHEESLEQTQKSANKNYVKLNLLSAKSVDSFFSRVAETVGSLEGASVILSVRLSLLFGGEQHVALASLLESLLETAIEAGVRNVLHISSVAVVDHLLSQNEMNEEEPLPDLEQYNKGQPYDVFKRLSEEIVTSVCSAHPRVNFTHLRLGAIYSNYQACIQMRGLLLQKRVAFNFTNGMDCNSSKNVGHAISLVIDRLERAPEKVRTCYYYTRNGSKPRSLSEFVVLYRRAHNVKIAIWLPFLIVKLLILLLRAVSLLVGRAVPLLRNLSYLATVAVTTHTFDNSRFRDKDFPEIKNREEDLVTCFRRIAARREAIMTKRK